MTGIEYRLVPATEISDEEIVNYLMEFGDYGEECYVLYRLYDIGISEWRKENKLHGRTTHYAFMVGDTLIGMGRVTKNLTYAANGNIGYAIRPSQRGKGYAPIMIRMTQDFCKEIGLDYFTACVDVTNEKSLKAFEKAGFIPTGKTYDWIGGRTAIELTPKKPSNSLHNRF